MIEIKRTNGAAFGSVQSLSGHEKMGQKCDIFLRPSNGKAPPFLLGRRSDRGVDCSVRALFFSRPKSFIFLNRVRLSIPRLSAVGPRFQLFFFKAFSR